MLTSVSHIVVGDGITALALLAARPVRAGEEIVIVGRGASQLGRGVAYARGEAGMPWRYAYLLNSPADDIDPAFARWLERRWDDVREVMRGRTPDWLASAEQLVAAGDLRGVNAPREFYGDFMAEEATRTLRDLHASGARVTLIDEEAASLDPGTTGPVLTTTSGRRFVARSIDIAPGGPSTMRFAGDDGPFAAPGVFGFEHRIAEHVLAGREIFCIGGNAAMLDVLRLCQSLVPEDKLRFTFCAPEGAVPPPLIPRLPRRITKPRLSRGHATAESFLAEIEREIARARREGDDTREIRAGFRAHFLANPIGEHVANSAEARRVPGKLRFWLRGGTRDTILDLRRLVAAGKVRIHSGAVTEIVHRPDGASIHLRDASGAPAQIDTGFAVNCAGAGPQSRFDPVTEKLLATGALSKCEVSGGLVTGAQCETGMSGVRHLSPATTVIGSEVMAMPLYDAHMLRTYAARAYEGALVACPM